MADKPTYDALKALAISIKAFRRIMFGKRPSENTGYPVEVYELDLAIKQLDVAIGESRPSNEGA